MAVNDPPENEPGGERDALTLRELNADWDGAWDALAGQASESGFMQSSAWAAFKRAEGYETFRYGLFQNGELRGGASLLHYAMQGSAGFLLCPEGPLVDWQNPGAARTGLRLIIGAARQLADAQGAIGLRIEPHLPPPRPSLLRNWSRAPIDLLPTHTLILDVTRPDSQLLSQMRPKGRYNLNLSARHGVTVRQSRDAADLAPFYALFAETAGRRQFYAEPYGYFLNLGASLFPNGDAALFLAEWRGEIISAILVTFFGRRATYLYGGSSPAHRAVMPNYALQWAAIQEARRRGCVEYDFYGYDPFGLPDHLFAGFTRFKLQFGAQRRDSFGAWDLLFYDQLADRLVERLRSAEPGSAPPSHAG